MMWQQDTHCQKVLEASFSIRTEKRFHTWQRHN